MNFSYVKPSNVYYNENSSTIVDGNNGMTMTPLTDDAIKGAVRWACHLHKSDARCEMRKVDEQYFHITQQKDTDAYAQVNFNAQQIPDEFWESFGTTLYISPIASSSANESFEVFKSIVYMFAELDSNQLKFHNKYNTPADFVTRHIICDDDGRIFLCNKHLLRKCSSKKPQEFYKRDIWIKAIVKELFPKITKLKNIPTSTPLWAMSLALPPATLLQQQQQQQLQQQQQQGDIVSSSSSTVGSLSLQPTSSKRKRRNRNNE